MKNNNDKVIISLSDENIFSQLSDYEICQKPENFEERVVVKALLLDENNIAGNHKGKIGFVTNDASGSLATVGGGADSSDLEGEIKREVLEETSLKVEVVRKQGVSVQYRNKIKTKYIVHHFLCTVIGKIEEDLREEDEKRVNMKAVFLDPEIAFHRMELQKGAVECGVWKEHYHSCFNMLRDYEVLKDFLDKK